MTRLEIKAKLVEYLITALSKLLTPDVIKVAVTAGLDTLEKVVTQSDNLVDDRLVLPIITALREIISVEDH